MMNSLFAQTIIAYLLIFAVPLVLPVLFLKVVGLSGLRTLVTYEARDTPLHKLDPRLKVLTQEIFVAAVVGHVLLLCLAMNGRRRRCAAAARAKTVPFYLSSHTDCPRACWAV